MLKFETRVVLVKTLFESNVGATSRVMSNMGAEQLILINPQCDLGYGAQLSAATGQTALQNHKEYKSWDEFYKSEPSSLRFAFTPKDGHLRQVQDFRQTLVELKPTFADRNKKGQSPVVHLIFGPEDSGLANEDLEWANCCVSLPTFGTNSSLNLAQAVLLGLYLLRQEWGTSNAVTDRKPEDLRSQFPETILSEFLEDLGLEIKKSRVNAFTVLRRLLLRQAPSTKELKILETVLRQASWKIKEYNEWRRGQGLSAGRDSLNGDSLK